jgi:hypothetical protein
MRIARQNIAFMTVHGDLIVGMGNYEHVVEDELRTTEGTVWSRRLPYGTEGGQFVLQFDLSAV